MCIRDRSNAPPKPPLVTGDTVLDALLSSENVQIQPTETVSPVTSGGLGGALLCGKGSGADAR